MFTCKKCNYLLDIVKSSTTKAKINLNTPDEYYKKILSLKKNNELVELININFGRDELINYLNKKKNIKNQDIYIKYFDELKLENKFVFKCKNCKIEYQILNKQIITSLRIKKTNKIIDNWSYTENQKKYLLNDPTLFRTKNYICPNDKCISNTDLSVKEAIIFRPDPKNYITNYICTNCETIF